MRASLARKTAQLAADAETRSNAADAVGGTPGVNPANLASAVVTTLGAYTGSKTGTLTASANGAFATQDGVAAAKSVVYFIQPGTANLTDPADSGPWVLSQVGTAGTPAILVRPPWWFTGDSILSGKRITIEGGTLFAGTEWQATATAVVDTVDPAFFVRVYTWTGTLVAGTKTFTAGTGGAPTNCPVGIFSATKTNFIVRVSTAGTQTGTFSYCVPGNPTPGYVGTAAVTMQASLTANGVSTNDTSTLAITAINGF